MISHLIGRETINIPEIFSGVHGFTGKTVSDTLFSNMVKKYNNKCTINDIFGNKNILHYEYYELVFMPI